MKIYTKTGDEGYTSLTGGKRIKKDDLLVEAYGTIDEANSMIGLAVAKLDHTSIEKAKTMLIRVQEDLFSVGAEISTPLDHEVYWPLDPKKVETLEAYIDELEEDIPKLTQFILPGGSEAGALLHLARTIIRRGERHSIGIDKKHVLAYLNRCSDFLFVTARWVNMKLNKIEKPFNP